MRWCACAATQRSVWHRLRPSMTRRWWRRTARRRRPAPSRETCRPRCGERAAATLPEYLAARSWHAAAAGRDSARTRIVAPCAGARARPSGCAAPATVSASSPPRWGCCSSRPRAGRACSAASRRGKPSFEYDRRADGRCSEGRPRRRAWGGCAEVQFTTLYLAQRPRPVQSRV